MLKDALTLSALIAAVLLVRAAFKNRVPKRLLYALWLVVLLKLCLPGTAYALPLLPAEQTAAVQQTETPAQPAPAAQQPTQAAAQPQTPAQQPASQPQEAAKPAAAMPLVTEPVLVIWFCGSALLIALRPNIAAVQNQRIQQVFFRRGQPQGTASTHGIAYNVGAALGAFMPHTRNLLQERFHHTHHGVVAIKLNVAWLTASAMPQEIKRVCAVIA